MKFLKLEDTYISIESINKINLFYHDDIYTIEIHSAGKIYENAWYGKCSIQSDKDAEIWVKCFIQCICEMDQSIVTIKDIEDVLYYLEDDKKPNYNYFDHNIDYHSMLIDWIIRHQERLGFTEVQKFIKEIKNSVSSFIPGAK